MPTNRPVAALFCLFALSGFTGLIYESLWTHYLKLFLGHAAFAQSFVLMVFMGGMAGGAWLASRRTERTRNLLAAYAGIEALIGLCALVFHEVFVFLTEVSLETIIPKLGDPLAVEAWKLALSTLLLLPQTLLLGMTFPLMSGAVLRRSPSDAAGRSASGHHLAMLYFTNSIGAAAGALACAFWLLGALGMPGTMRFAGFANLLLAGIVLWLARGTEPGTSFTVRDTAIGAPRSQVRLFLWAAFITGAASFIYEIAWVRMLSLVLGSSFQAFELMLSAFITGLALGGLWIRKRIDRIADPLRFSGWVQLLMGLAALGTLFVYHYMFDWMVWLLAVLQRNAAAYPLFNIGSHAIAFAVMLPATFLAGMTLPLFTHVLLRQGHGERAIGQIYAANTLGAITGVLVAVHLLLPQTGLKLSLIAGASLDMLLGVLLLSRSANAAGRDLRSAFAVAAGIAAIAIAVQAAVLDPARLSSGVYRYGRIDRDNVHIAYHRDGKTATVTLRRFDKKVFILTNGKSDAGVELDPLQPASPDESTMTLLPAIPLLMKPQTRHVAVIGFGSGLSSDVVLSHSGVQSVDTIEIEPAMVEAARGFFPRVRLVFEDPRSRIHIDDAKTFFARHQRRYDLIMSEPSNPWVNGVASLFSSEFYRDVRRYLAAGGLFVQWLQTYELEDRLVASVLAAIDGAFEDYAVYETGSGDLMVVAQASGRLPALGALPEKEERFMANLARIGVKDLRNIEVRRIATRQSLRPLLASLAVPANSDYYPLLQMEATRARFVAHPALGILAIASAPVPIREMLFEPDMRFLGERTGIARSDQIAWQNDALDIHRILASPAARAVSARNPEAMLPLATLKSGRPLCRIKVDPALLEQLHWVAEQTLSRLDSKRRRELWTDARWLGCAQAKIAPAAAGRLALYRAVAERHGARMLALGQAALSENPAGEPAWQKFALNTAMLGAHAQGKHAQAHRLWDEHGPMLYPRAVHKPAYVSYLANWTPSAR